MNSELRKLQFFGAGPKMAIPETEKLVKGGLDDTSDEQVADKSKPQREQISLYNFTFHPTNLLKRAVSCRLFLLELIENDQGR